MNTHAPAQTRAHDANREWLLTHSLTHSFTHTAVNVLTLSPRTHSLTHSPVHSTHSSACMKHHHARSGAQSEYDCECECSEWVSECEWLSDWVTDEWVKEWGWTTKYHSTTLAYRQGLNLLLTPPQSLLVRDSGLCSFKAQHRLFPEHVPANVRQLPGNVQGFNY